MLPPATPTPWRGGSGPSRAPPPHPPRRARPPRGPAPPPPPLRLRGGANAARAEPLAPAPPDLAAALNFPSLVKAGDALLAEGRREGRPGMLEDLSDRRHGLLLR